ncbi:MAG TPA: hypothetical protein VFB38_11930 [Chthonomonadaceae bacterium]|nr:hypothetical protein [Chthonomonadaceae bacterium]
MQNETDEILVNYFVLCDQVITEANTNKQSLIGIYSALMTDQLPMITNLSVAFGARVQSARPREFLLRLTGPDGEIVFASPPLSCDWESIQAGLRNNNFATLQFGINLRSIRFARPGLYTVTLHCEGSLLATYPVAVAHGGPGGLSAPPPPPE